MDDLQLYMYGILAGVAFLAGTVDTLAGGGGLITVPALLFSGVSPIFALGTDKLQSAIGELSATIHFFRNGNVNYKYIVFGLLYTIIGSVIGVVALQYMPIHKLEKLIPFLLMSVLLYYIFSGRNTSSESIDLLPGYSNKFFVPVGASIGFYNGFFGPGTGTLWAIAFMRLLKLNIQKATIYTKPLNLAANMAALTVFFVSGQINFYIAMAMGLGSFVGGKFGATLVMYKDAKWLKGMFLALMSISTLAMFVKYYYLNP